MAATHSWEYDGLLSLASPYLVRRVQEIFGIEFVDDPVKSSGRNVQNGCDLNGHNGYSLRSRTVDKNCHSPKLEKSRRNSSRTEKQNYIVRNKFFHHLFLFGAALGNELFYCFLWSALFWHVDMYVARGTVMVWCLTIYFGQALKELIAWPRPRSPPAAHLEGRYDLEFGMPSTHAVVGVTVPLAIYFFSSQRFQVDPVLMSTVLMSWCVLTCASRTYLGMHSVLDVLAGMLLGAVLMAPVIPLVNILDQLFIRHRYGLIFATIFAFTLCFIYPKLRRWNTSRADSYMVCAVTLGVYIGNHFNYQYGLYSVIKNSNFPKQILTPTPDFVLKCLAQSLIGGAILGLTRQICKVLVTNSLCFVFNLDRKNPQSMKVKRFEMPYKMLVYIPMSFVVVVICPHVFDYLRLASRPVGHFEYEWTMIC